jgi:hypothetical protein
LWSWSRGKWQVASCRSYIFVVGKAVLTLHPPLRPLSHNVNPRDGAQARHIGINRTVAPWLSRLWLGGPRKAAVKRSWHLDRIGTRTAGCKARGRRDRIAAAPSLQSRRSLVSTNLHRRHWGLAKERQRYRRGTYLLLEEGKEQRSRRSRSGRAELPGFFPSTKIDQGLTAVVEAPPARNYYEGYNGRTLVMCHGTSRKNWRCIEQGGFTPSRGGGLGAGVHVTRSEQKAAWCSGKHGSNEVVIKLKVALGRYVEINGQAHPLQMTWMEHGCGSAFAPAGAIGVREENCIAGPSRIEIIGPCAGIRRRAIMARAAHGRIQRLQANLIMAEEAITKQRHASGESARKGRAHLPSA